MIEKNRNEFDNKKSDQQSVRYSLALAMCRQYHICILYYQENVLPSITKEPLTLVMQSLLLDYDSSKNCLLALVSFTSVKQRIHSCFECFLLKYTIPKFLQMPRMPRMMCQECILSLILNKLLCQWYILVITTYSSPLFKDFILNCLSYDTWKGARLML